MINEPFQPLVSPGAADSAPTSSRLVVLAQPTSVRRFTPSAENAATASLTAAAIPQPPNSRIAVQREGDRVKLIELRCICGEVHQIECDY